MVERVLGERPVSVGSDSRLTSRLVEPGVRRHCNVGLLRWDAIVQASEWTVQLCDEDELASGRTVGFVASGIFWLQLV